jgi:hypothetical protein
MKKILLVASAFVFGIAAMAQQKVEDVAKFNAQKHNFGKIKQNVPAIYFFEITNISDKPLVVENASASCGCTTPELMPKGAILPGTTVKLKVQYNAAALAMFDKDVFVKFAGIDQPKALKIVGEVLEPVAYDTYVKEQSSKTPEKPSKGGN